ncbi:unnamed protein product [Mycena citricolor]|uniref:Uncharacterized protein n=1 Tax=Mycena citricolor TaxID=2018698 RepID=A0AAD2K8W9_9AGAR|nr:unnamed protein product [Mycena citricolor]
MAFFTLRTKHRGGGQDRDILETIWHPFPVLRISRPETMYQSGVTLSVPYRSRVATTAIDQ